MKLLSILTPAAVRASAAVITLSMCLAGGANGQSQGTIEAWGYDYYGTLHSVPPGHDYVSLAATGHQSFALASDGLVRGWGYSPTTYWGDFAKVASHGYLGIRRDGSLWGWGGLEWDLYYGIAPGYGYQHVAHGDWINVAVRSDGSLLAWGNDYYGQVSGTPTGAGFVAVEAGQYHCTAIRTDGSLVSWGVDSGGNAFQVSRTPTGPGFKSVSISRWHSTAVRTDGSLVSWGEPLSLPVVNTPSGNDFVAAAAGEEFSLALRADGSLVAWGYDRFGEVSNLPAGNDFIAIAAGRRHGLAIRRYVPVDADADGLLDTDEVSLYSTDPNDPDTDNDGLLDGEEVNAYFTAPTDADSDDDGLADGPEIRTFYTDVHDPDTDDDGLLDGTEVDMAQGSGCPSALIAESDGDGLLDGDEVALGTSPCTPDTDGDGVDDAFDPTPLVPGVPGSWIEATLRDESLAALDLSLSVINAPNANAGAGRRNSLSNGLGAAARLVDAGNEQGAIAELSALLARLDGAPAPTDWMVAGPESAALFARIQLMIYLLDYP